MIRIVIIALFLAGLVILFNYYRKSNSEQKRKIIKIVLFAILVVVLAGLVFAGRLNWLAAVGGSLAPLLPKIAGWVFRNISTILVLIRKYKTNKESGSASAIHGQQSKVETLYLIMLLDYDTGAMDGRVIKGEFKNKMLSEMTSLELRKMMKDCGDSETESLLMAYMDRYHRRNHAQDNNAGPDLNQPEFMSIHEAREVLGLSEGANKTEIIDAHRKLIQKLHPDRGGSEYLAMKINRAKDVLLAAL